MKFTQELEIEFFSAVLKDPKFIGRYVESFKNYRGSTFSMEWIRDELIKWYDKYKNLPAIEVWKSLIENQLDGENRKLVSSVVENLMNRESKAGEYAADSFLDFMSSKELERCVEEGRVLFQKTLDVSLYMSKLSEGLTLSERIRYGSNIDRVYDWLEQRKLRESKRGIISSGLKLGIPQLDEQFVFRRGTLTVFQGPYKRYKSIILHHCGFAGLLQGYNVLHVSFENTLQQVGDRYDSRFTGVDYKRMVRALTTGDEQRVMSTVFERLENLPNKLKIQRCAPYVDTVKTVEIAIDKLYRIGGWMPDIILFDYINLIACTKNIEDDYKRIELACWDMQNLGRERDIINISACQSQKGAEDRDDLKGSDTAGSVGILRASDNQIAINQTPEEKRMKIIRLSPVVFRDDDIITKDVPLNAELTRMCISRESDSLWGELDEDLS